MKLGIRGKLFLISVVLIVIAGLSWGLYVEGELRVRLEQRIETELVRHVRTARETIQATDKLDSIPAINQLATRLARAMDCRITVIAAGGRVLGDSDLTTPQVVAVDNHGNRPEVVAALAQGQGRSRRYSTTLGVEMLYVAVPYRADGEHDIGPPDGKPGIVRAARPLAEVDRAVARLRVLLWLAGIFGLVVAIAMSALASHFFSRTLRELARSARAISSGGYERRPRINVATSDEIGRLAGSLNRMSEDIEATVAALAAERSRFEAVLEGMNEAVIAIDSDFRITLTNSTAQELLELDHVPVGEPLIEHLRVPAIHDLLAEPGASATSEFELPGKVPRRVMSRVSPESDSGGCIVVLHDVTSIRRLETVRRDFVANVSHELRTPVSVIRANAETLLDGGIDDPVHSKRLLDALLRNAERLSRLLDDLLDLARIEAGRYDMERGEVLLARAAEQAIESVERTAREKRIELQCEIDDSLRVQADEKALDQILVNYLDNAVKYTPEGGAVSVSARADRDRVIIEIADNGPGIPPHLRERIFERFYRVDPGRSRNMGGTGLGLSIVKHLAEAMGGDAGVRAREPHGSRFWLSLARAEKQSGSRPSRS